MKTLYLNCFSGISGDMFLGAMLDLGVSREALSSGLEALGIEGLSIEVSGVTKKGIRATKADVIAPDTAEERHLAEILPIINGSDLPADVKRLSEAVFRRLGAAEAKVHGTGIEHVHFHEVGALDTIADVVGAAICLKEAGVEQVYASRVNVGSGKVRTSHGLLPVPAPATAELAPQHSHLLFGRDGRADYAHRCSHPRRDLQGHRPRACNAREKDGLRRGQQRPGNPERAHGYPGRDGQLV